VGTVVVGDALTNLTATDAVDRTDAALCQAKAAGRNRLVARQLT
jgi:PleD family two-component response regulator